MSDRYTYKPRFGFDIRVKPQTESAPPADERLCAWPGCDAPAPCQTSPAPDRLSERVWYCQPHARLHHQNWDYFKGKTDSEIAAYQESELTGHRPTWKLGVNGSTPSETARRLREHFRPGQDRPGRAGFATGDYADPYELFGADGAARRVESEAQRKVSRLQKAALEDLGLEPGAGLNEVKARYKELVKRFHPDANGGDRGAEDSLQRVIRAYQVLKTSGFR